MTLVQNMFIANKGVSSSHDREQLMEFFARDTVEEKRLHMHKGLQDNHFGHF